MIHKFEERKERRSDTAYRLIKLAILNGDFYPGALLLEQDLIEKFKLGRTPIREGVQRLIMEGLLYSIPRRGVFVSQISSNDAHDLYELRCKLDAFAAELAAKRATPEEIASMENLVEESLQFSEEEKVFFDERFHMMLYKASHNAELEKTLERLYQQSVRLFSIKGYKREPLDSMHDELAGILQAIKKHDAEGASKAALLHVKSRNWFDIKTLLI
jgi:DNA-binding GntR family transcriptional regulator